MIRLSSTLSDLWEEAEDYVYSFRLSMISLLADLGGLIAGLIIARYFSLISMYRWTISLYPGILSVRGVINGIFAGRLTTGLHLGIIKASLRRNTYEFKILMYSIYTLTIVSSLIMSSIVVVSNVECRVFEIALKVLTTSVITMCLSFAIVSLLTVSASILSMKLGLDPDYIVYPVMSTVADIVASLCYVAVLYILRENAFFNVLLSLGVTLIAITLYLFYNYYDEDEYIETIKESIITLTLVSAIVNLTGYILIKISEYIGRRAEVYIIYPAIIDTVGDVGSIVGSKTTTKLALGTIDPSLKALRDNMPEIVGSWLSSILMFMLYALTSGALTLSLDKMYSMVTVLLATNILSISAIIMLAHLIAIVAYEKGLNPDNFVNPIESTLADIIASLSLYLMLITIS
ncbi:MAG: hypothetical protein DRJ32_04480 [Thermoprotei archaeon]|nr:MAG: hypothetical protein DRJ32_04480 [Thermoprotei archaeon]HDD64216.1 hypothetical protein [Thermoprotei archaeon]